MACKNRVHKSEREFDQIAELCEGSNDATFDGVERLNAEATPQLRGMQRESAASPLPRWCCLTTHILRVAISVTPLQSDSFLYELSLTRSFSTVWLDRKIDICVDEL